MNYDIPAKVPTQTTAADRLEERISDLRVTLERLETVVGLLVDLPPKPHNPGGATLTPVVPPFFTRIDRCSERLANLTDELRALTNMIGDRL